MSGFITGFSNAFNQSFNNAREKRSQREDQVFEYKMSQFLKDKESRTSKRSQYDKWEQLSRKLAEDANMPGSEAAIFKHISAYGEEDAIKHIRSGRLKPVEQPKGQAGLTEKRLKATEASLNSQTDIALGAPVNQAPQGDANSFLAKMGINSSNVSKRLDEITGGEYSQSQQNPIEAPAFDGSSSGFVIDTSEPAAKLMASDIADIKYNLEKAKQSGDAASVADLEMRMAAIAYASDEEARIALESKGIPMQDIVINDGNGARIFSAPFRKNGEGETVFTLPNGQTTTLGEGVRLAGPDERERMRSVLESMSGSAKDYNKTLTVATEAFEGAGRLVEIVENHPGVLLKAGGVLDWGVSLGTEISKGSELLLGNIVTEDGTNGRQALEQADGLFKDLQDTKGTAMGDEGFRKQVQQRSEQLMGLFNEEQLDVAAKRRVFNSLLRLQAYKIASLAGQEGREVSDKELERFMQIVSGGATVDKFSENMRGYMGTAVSTLNTQHGVLMNDPNLVGFMREFGYSTNDLPWAPRSLEESIAATNGADNVSGSYAQKGYEFLRADNFMQPRSTDGVPVESRGEVLSDGAVPTNILLETFSDEVRMLTENPTQEMRDFFDQEFGEGAADRVLQERNQIDNQGIPTGG